MCSKTQIIDFIKENNYKEFYKNISITLINSKKIFNVAAAFGKVGFVTYMIKKIITMENLKNTLLCRLSLPIREIVLSRMILMENQMRAGYNRLHIAVMDNEVDLVKHLLDTNSIYSQDSSPPIGTPLHLAIVLCHVECIIAFIDHGANVDIVNKNKETAIHLMLQYKLPATCYGLFSLSKDINDVKYDGLTILQMAIVHNCKEAIEELLEKGADITVEIEKEDADEMMETISQYESIVHCYPISKTENCLTLCIKMFKIIHPSLLEKLDDESINMVDGEGNTLLHIAASLQDVDLCKVLLGKGIDVNALNNAGNNALQEMLNYRSKLALAIKKVVELGTLLIDSGLDVDNLGPDGESLLFKCMEVNHEKFFIRVLDSMTFFDLSVSEFESVVRRRWFSAVDEILSSITDDTKCSLLTKSVLEVYYTLRSDSELVKLVKQCSETVRCEIIDKILNRAALQDKVDIFKECLALSGTSSKLLEDGETLLTSLIKKKKTSFVILLLDSHLEDSLINMVNSSLESALHVAIKIKDKDLVDNFVVEMSDINGEDLEGDSVLGLLFQHFTSEADNAFVKRMAKIIISRGGNPSHRNMKGVEDISYCEQEHIKTNILKYSKKQVKVAAFNQECSICFDDPVDCSLECGHAYCTKCAHKISLCPACRKPPGIVKKLFL